MKRPERRAEPRSRHGEFLQHAPEQNRGGGVHEDVEEMKREWIKSPQRVAEPQCGQSEREVIGVGAGPDAGESERPGDARVLGEMQVVVQMNRARQAG